MKKYVRNLAQIRAFEWGDREITVKKPLKQEAIHANQLHLHSTCPMVPN